MMPLCDVGKAPSQWFNMMTCWDDGYPVASDKRRRCTIDLWTTNKSDLFPSRTSTMNEIDRSLNQRSAIRANTKREMITNDSRYGECGMKSGDMQSSGTVIR